MKRRRRLRWKLIAIALSVAAVGLGGGYALYRVRATSALQAAKEQAFRAAERGDHEQAVRLMEAYLSRYRDDAAAVRELAGLLEKTAKLPSDRLRVLHTLDRALQIAPDDTSTRRLAVQKALELRRWKDAQDHLTILQRDFPNDAVVHRQLGECAEGQGQEAQAAEFYRKAIALDPRETEAHVRLARWLWHQPDQRDQADQLMAQLRQAAPDSISARLALARFFRDTNRPEQARSDIEFALRQEPDSVEVRYEAALHEIAMGHLRAAEEHTAAGLNRNPRHLPLLKLRVELERRSQQAASDDLKEMVRRTVTLLEENPRKTADVLDLLIDVDELALARDILNGPRGENLPSHLRDFLEARLKIAEEDYARARDLLERCRAALAPVPTLARYANLFLGICQRRLGQLDPAAASFRTALDLSPGWLPAQLELGATEAERGRLAEAIAIYRRLIPQVPQARLMVARWLLQEITKSPPHLRDWSPVETLLAESSPDERKTPEWRLVRTSLLLAQGKEAEALEELDAAIHGEPRDLAPRLALVSLHLQRRDFAQAEEALLAARKELGDRVELRLAQANLHLLRDGPRGAPAIESLADRVESFSRIDQVRLLTGLYRVAQGVDLKLTRRIGGLLVERQPHRADLRFGLLRLALAENDEAAARQLVRELRQAEGERGAYWRCGEVAVALQFAAPNDTTWFATARNLAAEASRLRPDWGLPVLLLAQIDERQGLTAEAMQRYRSAIELGEQSAEVIRRTVQLLHSQHRYEEAQELLRRLATQSTAADPELRRLTLPAMIGRESAEQIIAQAKELAPEDSRQYRDHLWLGQVLAALGGRAAEAEAAFRRAIREEPKAGDAWVALVTYLASLPDRPKAASAAQEAASVLRGPDHALALAVCYEAAGQPAQAESVLLDALKEKKDDPSLQRQLAGLYWRRGEFAKADPILLRLSEGKGEDAGWARRHRAIALARSGSYAKIREALPLIERNLEDAGASPEDQRARALLLSVQPGRRAEALKAFEASLRNLPATADELLILAQLYEASGNWPAARERLAAITTSTAEARHLEYFIQRLLYHDEVAAAELALEKLERLAPDAWGTVSLKARILARTDRVEEARGLLRQRVVGAADLQQVLAAGRLLEELGQWRDAEQAYLRYRLRKGGSGAEADWPLARFYALRERIDDALNLCETTCAQAAPELVAVIAAALVRSPKLDEAASRRVEAWLSQAVRRHPDAAAAWMAMADFHEQRGNPSEAELIYERILSREPAHVAAMNNLAVLLSWRGQAERALRLVNAAIDQVGPQPALLDTRGIAHFAAGNLEAALADLAESVALQETAVRRFHLALVQQAAGKTDEASQSLQRAKELGLTESQLHPLERSRGRDMGI